MFLDGAHVVAAAVADPAVGNAWDRQSVLEDQLVGGVAGHLARGGVWVVADYLDTGDPGRPVDLETATEYFASFVDKATPERHQAIRDRGAAVAAVGQQDLIRQLDDRLAVLEPRLRSLDTTRLIEVAGGAVMRVGDYLVTRVVEQVVHLDDLARSIDRESWPYPAGAEDLAVEVGLGVARLRNTPTSLLRGLYRRGFGEVILPVL